MLSSLILRISVRFLTVILVIFSIFLFVRGHHEPGGGFGAGLVNAAAAGLLSLAYGVATTYRVIRLDPRLLISLGLIVILTSGFAGLALGYPFLSGVWIELYLPILGQVELGTPLLFEAGVYFIVTGGVILILLTIQETE